MFYLQFVILSAVKDLSSTFGRRHRAATTLVCALLLAFPTILAGWVAAAQLQDAIFAAAVASHCLLALTVPPARVFCRRHSRTGLPYARNRPREPRSGISSILPYSTIGTSLFPTRPRRRLIQSRKRLRRLQHIIRKEKFPVRWHHHDLHPVAQPLRHRQLHQHRVHL